MGAGTGGRPDILLEVEIPERLSGGGPVVYTPDYLEHRGNRICYDDVTGLACNLSRGFLKFLSPYESLYYRVSAGSRSIGFVVAPKARMRLRERPDTIRRIVEVTKERIEPRLRSMLIRRICDEGGRVAIGNVEIDAAGYEKAALFSGKRRVLWQERIHKPEAADGKVILFKDDGGRPLVFCAVSLESDNAVLLPELIPAVKNRLFP